MYLSKYCLTCVTILAFAEAAMGFRRCYDCLPYTDCPEAKDRAEMDKSEATKQLFKRAYCGMHNSKIAKVCCSDFDSLSVDDRWSVLDSQPEHPNTKLLPDSCGTIAQDRIIGGVVATLYEFPWTVLIGYCHGADVSFGCSGTLINSRYVLTAAHCVVNQNIKGVRVGEYDLHTDIDCMGNVCESYLQDLKVENQTVHEDYDCNKYTNDIALLRLKTPVDLTRKNADTICLPTTVEMQNKPLTDNSATVIGWGLTEFGRTSSVLRKVVVPVRSNDVCREYYSKLLASDRSHFCAGEYRKDSCRGDSGGPLMIETMINGHSRYVQYGIVSNGPQRCGSYSPGLYTDVRTYVNWILDNIKG